MPMIIKQAFSIVNIFFNFWLTLVFGWDKLWLLNLADETFGGVKTVKEILGYQLEQTCGACPEQYDVFHNEIEAGYLRLRHGRFTVEYPSVGGEEIYSACPRGDGTFHDDERERYLTEAIQAIRQRHEGINSSGEDLKAENERLRAALERLGSMEALSLGRHIDLSRDVELLARIVFANKALKEGE